MKQPRRLGHVPGDKIVIFEEKQDQTGNSDTTISKGDAVYPALAPSYA